MWVILVHEALWGRAIPPDLGTSFSARPCQLRVPTHVTRPLFRPVFPRTKAGCLCWPQRLPTQTRQCPLCGHAMTNEAWPPCWPPESQKALLRWLCQGPLCPPSLASPHPAAGPNCSAPPGPSPETTQCLFSLSPAISCGHWGGGSLSPGLSCGGPYLPRGLWGFLIGAYAHPAGAPAPAPLPGLGRAESAGTVPALCPRSSRPARPAPPLPGRWL